MNLREIERASLTAFVQDSADKGLLDGDVLDLGCGHQPYRKLVRGKYFAWDRAHYPGSVVALDIGAAYKDKGTPWDRTYDTVLCTQVIQYVDDPSALMRTILRHANHLVMTGPTNWPVVEKEDLRRFTPTGISELLHRAGFLSIEVTEREYVIFEGERWCLGWGVVSHV